MPGIYEFYMERIKASRRYTPVGAKGILLTVVNCAMNDDLLTVDDFFIILDNAITEYQCRLQEEEEKEDNE